MRIESFADHLAVPVGHGHIFRLGCDPIPEGLNIIDPLFDRQIVEAGRRQCYARRHEIRLSSTGARKPTSPNGLERATDAVTIGADKGISPISCRLVPMKAILDLSPFRHSGLQYAQARWYDPAVGMFLTHDPEGEFHSPYIYTGGDPINRTDPTGRSVFRVYGNLCDMPGEDCSSVRRPGGAGGGGGVFIGGTRDINTGCPMGMVPYGFGQCLPPAQIELIERAQRDREESARRDAGRKPGGEVGPAPPAASPASEDPARPAAAAPEPSHGESVRDTIIEAAPEIVLAFIPVYGVVMDLSVMFGTDYSWTDRGLASVSFLGSVFHGGAGPNIGPVLRARARAARGTPKWPKTAQEMDDFLKVPGQKIPDGHTTPGRGKTVWRPNKDTKITLEQHPYDTTAPDWHKGPHWHLDTPGIKPHQRYVPGDDIPGY